jgi:hypothetical protein
VPGDGPVRTTAQPSSAAGNRAFEVTPGTYLFEAELQASR